MRVTVDLGFSSLVFPCLVFVVVLVIGFVVRRKWMRAVARTEEVKRLLDFAKEEAARVENEASYQYGAVLVAKNNQCAVCFCPTTTRCARCKTVHYCSGKCQILHWRQGHKEECHPPSTTSETDDLIDDLGKKVAEQGYHGIHDDMVQDESMEYKTSTKKLQTSDNIRVEANTKDVTDSNSELSSNSFSGFSASNSAGESSDDSSVCESMTSNEHGRSEGHVFADPTLVISDTTSNDDSKGVAIPLSPKFASLVDSVVGFSTKDKLNQVRPVFGKEESKLTFNGSSGLSMQKTVAIEPSSVTSGFWDKTHAPRGIKDDASSDSLRSHTNDYLPKSVRNNMPCAKSASSEDEGVDSTGCTEASSIHNLQSVGFKVSNHVMNNPGSPLKSAGIKSLSYAFADTKLASRTKELSHYSTKSGDNGNQSGTCTSTQVASCSPNSKNGLKTSVPKVVDQFRGSNLSNHFPQVVGSDIGGLYSDKGLFPYDLFVKLYTLNRVELQPFGLLNCGNSCYANAVLQCLAFTPPLTAYMLQGLHSKSCVNKKWCFICEFEKLILKSKYAEASLSPMGILSQLQNIGSQLGNGREEDAHEFLRLTVETMQSVCLMEAGVNASNSLKEETNLMGLTFGGYLRSKIQCVKCGGKSEHQERMMDLTVEIEGEVATLEEALRRFTSTETLDGENKYHCMSRCKSYEKAKKKLTVSEAPNVLTIALKRFQSGKFGKLNKPIRFPEILDLAPFMSGTSDSSPIYKLYGVVVHLDTMNIAFSGHYVCYVKTFQNKWFKIDDSVVKVVELERVLTKGAYILLYARCSPKAPRLIRNRIVSSDSKAEVYGKAVTMKARHVSTDSGAVECMTSSISLDGSPTFKTLHSKFDHMKRILDEDSCSDNSSLISNNSDEGSCSTDSTRDSSSTEDFGDYIFGDAGPSVFSHAAGLQPPPTGSTRIHRRKLDTSRDSNSFREIDLFERVGSNHFNVINCGVSCRKSRERTD
ncbi:PREDICTED: ubiquitin carboxyl-terminal hydrolase 16-like isoform X3 [Lupinus angustifolius]|uniref:ubiquitin carboxyl-terminal hydrolase 16-like isoform X3 n=1 Tax=Lupinus angustifolius TaxID=3871 RepID=UPI00092EC744|nr:PREDICTED: ubiquitin carboxyl-terminal hydrolase 16-like isoform X3 [Lupinus angustifolius]